MQVRTLATHGIDKQSAGPQWPWDSIPGTYNVGGRRVTKPTSEIRDSSLGIDKAPGIQSTRTPQLRKANVGRMTAGRQGQSRRTLGRLRPCTRETVNLRSLNGTRQPLAFSKGHLALQHIFDLGPLRWR